MAALTRFVVDYTIQLERVPTEVLSFPPDDDATMRTIERPVVYSGRVFDPARPDEVDVTRGFVSTFHLGVGDSVRLDLPTEAELMQGASPPFHGPVVTEHIVGVVESPWFSDAVGAPGAMFLSPGLARTYPGSVLGDQSSPEDTNFVNALVRLRGGEAAIPQFRRDLARLTGRSDIDVWDLSAQARQDQRNIEFESWCLIVFGLVAMAAALFLAGQAISRFAQAEVESLRTMQAMGMTRNQVTAAATAAPALAGVAGALLGVVAAYVASSWFPIGSAGLLEPSPGRSWDWLVLVGGALATVALVVVGVALTTRRALAARVESTDRSILTEMVSRGGWPVSVLIGTRFALEPGRGRNAVPVRPAIVGAVIGMLGISAAFTFSYAVNDASSKPQRFGQTYQGAAFVGLNSQDFAPVPRLIRDLEASKQVTGVLHARSGVVGNPSGTASITLYTYEREAKVLPVVLTSGRLPEQPDEIVLAPSSLASLHTSVGRWTVLEGSGGRQRYLVTGSGFVPSGSHNTYDDGGWVTPSGFVHVVKGFKFDVVLFSLASAEHGSPAQVASVSREVARRDPSMASVGLSPPDPLQPVAELQQVRRLPFALGIFLIVLALGAVGHALATAVRRRSRDLAVLRAIGMTPRQCRRAIIVQSTLLGAIGLILGVPLGLAVGRLVWHAVATYTPLQYVTPLAGWEIPLLIPAALLAVNLLALWPSHRAARLRVSEVLRTE